MRWKVDSAILIYERHGSLYHSNKVNVYLDKNCDILASRLIRYTRKSIHQKRLALTVWCGTSSTPGADSEQERFTTRRLTLSIGVYIIYIQWNPSEKARNVSRSLRNLVHFHAPFFTNHVYFTPHCRSAPGDNLEMLKCVIILELVAWNIIALGSFCSTSKRFANTSFT